MKLADSNVFLALALSGHVFHKVAQSWLDEQTAEGGVVFCRSTQQSFLRLLTTEAVFKPYGMRPLGDSLAWSFYERFLADRRFAYADEPLGLEVQWKLLSVRETSSPKLGMDAYLAAFAIAGGFQLVTIDQGFEKYQGLDIFLIP